ncbi:MAG: hypothetical protein CMI53_00145 [Parcubacteria group bacterium]|nr:hypothetical protein [Parcubacteria group bacterium]|tara:strand:- start:268 stop:1701 length:1434 start_codon:yes stop_codon:yes gene_type:complete
MNINLFGKLFKGVIATLILTELFSLVSYQIPPLNQVAFFVVLIVVLFLSLRKLEYGLYILLAEIFVGGLGHLFSFDIFGVSLSIRLGLFLVIIGAWLIKIIKKKEKFQIQNSKFKIPNLFLAIAILIGAINGLYNNELINVFLDFNAWIYFLLIPVFLTVIKGQKIIENILQILIGATTYLSLKTLIVLFLFSHNIAGIGGFFYKWIRDTGVGEITFVSGTIFRVFFQSQIYALMGFFIVLVIVAYNFRLKEWKKYVVPVLYLYLTSLTIIISQSRSYWVGGLFGLISLIIFGWWKFNFKLKKIVVLLLMSLMFLADQILLINFITNNFSGNLVADRFKGLQTEAAGVSRLNQLGPLSQAISRQPLFGYGFGKELTYKSLDPRILNNNPDGTYTTYAFEWGYLDIWLKIGLLGLSAYSLLIGLLFYLGLKKTSSITGLKIGLLTALTALLVTNIFSPYLNHPLGISYIMLLLATLRD